MSDDHAAARWLARLAELTARPEASEIRESITNALASGATGDEIVYALTGEATDEVAVADEMDMALGCVRTVYAFGLRIALGNADGRLFALEATCPHANGPLDHGTLDGTILSCPLHGFEFDALTGECRTRPEDGVRPIPLEVRDGQVVLKRPG